MSIRTGTAGWSIPRDSAYAFPHDGSSLSRYSGQFSVAEINSSFHRRHRQSTWERWRESVPESFRFSVKVPKSITHERKLVGCELLLDEFLAQAGILGEKLAVLLVQLPPKLQFDGAIAGEFFSILHARTNVKVACEPRHVSWFTPEADMRLAQLLVARVAADPAICEAATAPAGWSGLRYWRLHGSPSIYRSSYRDRLGSYARKLEDEAGDGSDVWCIFDNTASSAAVTDALALKQTMEERSAPE